METIERKTKSKIKKPTPSITEWITTMKNLDLELERLNALFITASFTLSRQEYQRLIFLRQSHADLKSKMVKYFEKSRRAGIGMRRNSQKSLAQTSDNLEQELLDLTRQLKKFTDNLLNVKRNSRSYL